jgi:hypothetical protein
MNQTIQVTGTSTSIKPHFAEKRKGKIHLPDLQELNHSVKAIMKDIHSKLLPLKEKEFRITLVWRRSKLD